MQHDFFLMKWLWYNGDGLNQDITDIVHIVRTIRAKDSKFCDGNTFHSGPPRILSLHVAEVRLHGTTSIVNVSANLHKPDTIVSTVLQSTKRAIFYLRSTILVEMYYLSMLFIRHARGAVCHLKEGQHRRIDWHNYTNGAVKKKLRYFYRACEMLNTIRWII